MKYKRWLFNLLLLLGGTLFALPLGELLVRLSGKAPQIAFLEKNGYRLSKNKILAYEPVPGYGVSNSLGFRDREHPREKDPAVKRILLLGDSIAAGWGVAAQEGFGARLERMLNARGVSCAVVNFAVNGYNTQQEVELYRDRGRPFVPDLILLAYCQNDREYVSVELMRILNEDQAGGGSIAWNRLSRPLSWSHLYRLLCATFQRPPRHINLEAKPADAASREKLEASVRAQARDYPHLLEDHSAAALAQLSRLAGEDGAQAAVLIFPYFEQYLEQPDSGEAVYPFAEQHRQIAADAAACGMPCLDLLPAFKSRAQRDGTKLNLDRFHPNAQGHLCAAEALAQFIIEQNLLN